MAEQKPKKLFTTLASVAVGTLIIGGLGPGVASSFADSHGGPTEQGEKNCSGEKSCSGDKDCSGEKSCSGDKGCGGESEE